MFYVSVCHAALDPMYQLSGTRGIMSDEGDPAGFLKTVISLLKSTHSTFQFGVCNTCGYVF